MHLNCPSCQRRLWFAYMSDASLSVTDGSMNLEDVLRLGMTLRDEVFRVHEGAVRKLLGPTPPEGIPIRRFQPVVMTDLDKTPASFCFGEPGEVILQLICSEPDASPKHERTVYGVLLRSSGERGEDMQSKVEAYLATEGVQWTGLDLEAFLESASQSDK